jgi:hypothetical protein
MYVMKLFDDKFSVKMKPNTHGLLSEEAQSTPTVTQRFSNARPLQHGADVCAPSSILSD